MSRSQEPPRTFLPFGNPFRMILPKGSYPSPKQLDLLNTFEETLSGRLKNLKPANQNDVLHLSWMRKATESLCETHADIKILITALELPVRDWDEKWIDVYLSNSMKLLDICLSFTSEIARLRQGHLFLACALHDLKSASSKKFIEARSSLDEWKHFINSKNPRLDECFSIMDNLVKTIDDVPKIKNSSKGKILMRAMYGVKVLTLFVCSSFFAAFSGSAKKLIDLRVPEACSWAPAFIDVQNFVNTAIRNKYSKGMLTVLKELEDVYVIVKELYPIVQDGVRDAAEAEMFGKIVLDLEKTDEKLYEGLNLVGKEVDGFFKVILSGRDALLCNLRFVGSVSDEVRSVVNVHGQAVR
ncbi:protein bps1 chloroplastic [Phtheirospermum japonicum]|uniref:Protein bps1 chloroplastic n=1 Tax=Phtheirospermum japonicum TaxID=374723 RepID=A0A830CQL8_9LAMI|nr:protein bps1 chloroplastic [Phtheirospermum japonicum]